jgi:ribokinase
VNVSDRTESVTVIGDLMMDLIVQIPHLPVPGTDTQAEIGYHLGGAAGNVAAWLASLQIPTAILGRVGCDPFGDETLRALDSAGITLHVTRDPDRSTGICISLVTPDGERTMMPDLGANAGLRPEHLIEQALPTGGHVHMSGYSLLHDETRITALGALDVARHRDMTVSIDASSVEPLRAAGPATFLGWIAPCSILFANAEEALTLTGKDNPESAALQLRDSAAVVVVKLGPDGALVAHGQTVTHKPALPVESDVLDTTGAGDAFTAGFLRGWIRREGIDAALEWGLDTAARAVASVGARP